MRATDPAMFEQLEAMGAPLVTEARMTYTEVAPRRRLGYSHTVDFIPGIAPYEIAHLVELHQVPRGVRMVLTFDAMHDEEWTQRAAMGWQQELKKSSRSWPRRSPGVGWRRRSGPGQGLRGHLGGHCHRCDG